MQIVLAGLGGQGVLFCARVLALAGRAAGHAVLVGETHGMSQRGGSVLAHVKLGDFASSLVREGAADAVCCLDASQAAAAIRYARPGRGLVVALAAHEALDPAVVAYASRCGIAVHGCDARALAAAAGDPRTHNVALLGFAAARLEGLPPLDALARAVEEASPPSARGRNGQVLAAGGAAARTAVGVGDV